MGNQVRNTQALILGTGEFSFAPSASTIAQAQSAGFIDFGNITAVGFKPSLEKLEHEGSYEGIKRVDRTTVTKAVHEYNIKCDEWDVEKLKIALFGSDTTDFSQGVITAQNGAVLGFTVTPAVINRWYDLTVTGVRVREITTVTIATLVEGTDFIVDKKAGRIRFLTAQSTDRTPVITAPTVTFGTTPSFQGIIPLNTYIRSGIGRLLIYDDTHPNKLVYDHHDFGCEVYLENADELDGKKYAEMQLRVVVTSPVGVVYCAE